MTEPLGEFDPVAERVRQQLRTFPLKFRELGEGGMLRTILTEGETTALEGPIVGQQPETFTEQYLIEPVLHSLRYIDPASTEYDGSGPHFVRRPRHSETSRANVPTTCWNRLTRRWSVSSEQRPPTGNRRRSGRRRTTSATTSK